MQSRDSITIVASALIATACATTAPPPTKMLVESRAAVRVAEQTGAERDPGAARYLALARQHISETERLMSERDHAAARRVLEAAHVHAVMSSELARHANGAPRPPRRARRSKSSAHASPEPRSRSCSCDFVYPSSLSR